MWRRLFLPTKKKTVDKYSYVATLDEIKENDYNLNIPRYVDTFEEEEQISLGGSWVTAIQQTQKEIMQAEKELFALFGELHGTNDDVDRELQNALAKLMNVGDGNEQQNTKFPDIRFKGFTDAWEQRKLGELGQIMTGTTPPTNDVDNYSEDGMIWVTPTDIIKNVTTDTKLKSCQKKGSPQPELVPPGTILVTCIAYREKILWSQHL